MRCAVSQVPAKAGYGAAGPAGDGVEQQPCESGELVGQG